MRFFWKLVAKLYTALYFLNFKLPPFDFLFHQPALKLPLKYTETIWADTSFNEIERQHIIGAINDINYFCNGFITINIRFELEDSHCIDHHCVMKKVDGYHPSIIKADDKLNSKIIGLCEHWHNYTRKIYIVSERMPNPDIFKTTVVHELGHFIGMKHTKNESIMYRFNNGMILYPTYIDAVELAKQWQINPEQLRYFEL